MFFAGNGATKTPSETPFPFHAWISVHDELTNHRQHEAAATSRLWIPGSCSDGKAGPGHSDDDPRKDPDKGCRDRLEDCPEGGEDADDLASLLGRACRGEETPGRHDDGPKHCICNQHAGDRRDEGSPQIGKERFAGSGMTRDQRRGPEGEEVENECREDI